VNCINPGHAVAGATCAGCYSALSAELTALNGRHMRLLAENGELERKVREAEGRGLSIPQPADRRNGTQGSSAGFEAVNSEEVLQISGGTRPAASDEVVLRIMYRTTGAGRAILLERAAARALHGWLGWWLENGWPGVARQCGEHHRLDDWVHDWQCDQDPDHRGDHEGPAIVWAAGERPRQRRSWPRTEPAQRTGGRP
jgi:hypothetical protein